MKAIERIWLSVALILLSGASLAAETGFLVLHQKGQATALQPNKVVPRVLERGLTVMAWDRVVMGRGGELLAENHHREKLWLASLGMVEWRKEEGVRRFILMRGALQLQSFQTPVPLEAEVPYGILKGKGESLYRLYLQHDESAILQLEEGTLSVQHPSEGEVKVEAPAEMLIDQHGVRPLPQRQKEASRAIFDFRLEEQTTYEELASRQAKKGDEEKKGDDAVSSTVRGKASDAKLVEGQADGEGEYRWDFAMNPWFLLIPLVLGGGLYEYFRRKRVAMEASNTPSGSENGDQSYETEDIEVIRGNLTANDPPLKTRKVTHILGDVEDGASIEADHDVLVKGCVQGARMDCRAGLRVERGINGQGKAVLKVKGDLSTSYISDAAVVCQGSMQVDQAIRNAEVAANGQVEVFKKSIVGGWVSSFQGVSCAELGSNFGETEILLGQSALQVWSEKEKGEVDFQAPESFNKKASLAVMEEWISATVVHGEAKLEQKDPLPGPIKTRIDPTDRTRLQVEGFRKDEDPSN